MAALLPWHGARASRPEPPQAIINPNPFDYGYQNRPASSDMSAFMTMSHQLMTRFRSCIAVLVGYLSLVWSALPSVFAGSLTN